MAVEALKTEYGAGPMEINTIFPILLIVRDTVGISDVKENIIGGFSSSHKIIQKKNKNAAFDSRRSNHRRIKVIIVTVVLSVIELFFAMQVWEAKSKKGNQEQPHPVDREMPSTGPKYRILDTFNATNLLRVRHRSGHYYGAYDFMQWQIRDFAGER